VPLLLLLLVVTLKPAPRWSLTLATRSRLPMLTSTKDIEGMHPPLLLAGPTLARWREEGGGGAAAARLTAEPAAAAGSQEDATEEVASAPPSSTATAAPRAEDSDVEGAAKALAFSADRDEEAPASEPTAAIASADGT